MTYPPSDHVLRDLQIASVLDAPDRASAELEITPALHDTSGVVSVGALVTLVDLACARVALPAAAPHWTATIDLSLVSGARPARGLVHAEARIVRVGSRIVVIDVDLGDAGTATASFARIPREASVVEQLLPTIGVQSQLERTGPPVAMPLVERMGIHGAGGTAELDRSDYVRNSFGSVNGGVLGFLVAAAAESATGRTAADVTLRYVGQTEVGPARATARVVRAAADHSAVDVTVRDAGAAGAVLTRALVTVT